MKRKILTWFSDVYPRCAICGKQAQYDCVDEFHVQVLLCEKHVNNDQVPWKHTHAEIPDVIYPACKECNRKEHG